LQVGLHQSLLPLQTDSSILWIIIGKITNYFSVHYLVGFPLLYKVLATSVTLEQKLNSESEDAAREIYADMMQMQHYQPTW